MRRKKKKSWTTFNSKGFPIILIIWSGDEEFPSKASLLLDENCSSHMPVDIIWSIAMMTMEIMQS